MPTRTSQTRRASTSPSRFSKPGGTPRAAGAGRFMRPGGTQASRSGRFATRPLANPRPATRGRGRAKIKPGGVNGLLSTAMTALPVGVKKSGRSSGGGKGKPAMALLAAAGAVLGRRQMRKRRGAEAPPVSTTTPTTPPVTPA
jgi:hypothetical protein